MIFDFKRFYPSLQAWQDLEGSECSACSRPLQINFNATGYVRDAVRCISCDWHLDFHTDHNTQCTRPYILRCKGFEFCLGYSPDPVPNAAQIDVLYVKELSDYAPWEILSRRNSILSLKGILQMMRTGELRAAIKNAQIKRDLKRFI
jgi:hypothetical protein